jgi:hypothetical protein
MIRDRRLGLSDAHAPYLNLILSMLASCIRIKIWATVAALETFWQGFSASGTSSV